MIPNEEIRMRIAIKLQVLKPYQKRELGIVSPVTLDEVVRSVMEVLNRSIVVRPDYLPGAHRLPSLAWMSPGLRDANRATAAKVARYGPAGSPTPTNLLEAAAWHFAVVATGRRCQACGMFDPHALWALFERRGWDVGMQSVTPASPLQALRGRRVRVLVQGSRADRGPSHAKPPTVEAGA